MNMIATVKRENLPKLLDRAARMLIEAKTHADVLEARDQANFIYSASKALSRIEKAKTAHDSLLVQVHRAQADALIIEAQAKMRLADEYDAAQEAGEVQKVGGDRVSIVANGNNGPATTADLGLRRDEIHEARELRNFERNNPNEIKGVLHDMVERGEEPTKAALRRHINPKPKNKPMDDKALFLWGRLNDFERHGLLDSDPQYLLSEMTQPMRDQVRRLAPLVREFITELELQT